MQQYMDHIENILKYEPMTIFARPTYLPVNFGRYYDALWTAERVQTIIQLAKARDIAFEISTPMHVPKKEIIIEAKKAGLKFTFGTNARNFDAGKLHYGLKMAEECGLTREDMLIL
jgi:histidinol phosphatase-like PHP family hydrolase